MPRTSLNPAPTPWQRHVAAWRDCRRCEYAALRRRVVLARGKLPADVLFIGEGPGRSEDVLGEPFVGPAGQLLDDIIGRAGGLGFRLAWTNLVACIPKGTDGEKVGRPDPKCIKACSPRLVDLIRLADPKLIVYVGDDAARWVDKVVPNHGRTAVHVHHPAWLLRRPPASRGVDIQLVEVRLRKAFAALANGTVMRPVPGVPRTEAELARRKQQDIAEFGEELPF